MAASKSGLSSVFSGADARKWLLARYEPEVDETEPEVDETDLELLEKALGEQFYEECWKWRKNQHGSEVMDDCQKWLNGLPTGINIPYTYHDIHLCLLNDWKLTSDVDQAKDGDFQNWRYWRPLSAQIVMMMYRHVDAAIG